MAQFLFALRDDTNLTEGVASGPIRTYLEQNPNFQNFENLISYILERKDYFSAARVTYNYLRSIDSVTLSIDDEEITTVNASQFLLDLPITSFLGFLSLATGQPTQVYRYGIKNGNSLNTYATLTEFANALGTEGITLTNEDVMNLYRSKERIEDESKCKIITHNVIDEDGNLLNCWACTAPGCSAAGTHIEEYKQHLEEAHNDVFSFMDPIWGDVFRYIVKQNTVPKTRDFFKPLFIAGLFIETNEEYENHSTHIFIFYA